MGAIIFYTYLLCLDIICSAAAVFVSELGPDRMWETRQMSENPFIWSKEVCLGSLKYKLLLNLLVTTCCSCFIYILYVDTASMRISGLWIKICSIASLPLLILPMSYIYIYRSMVTYLTNLLCHFINTTVWNLIVNTGNEGKDTLVNNKKLIFPIQEYVFSILKYKRYSYYCWALKESKLGAACPLWALSINDGS